MERLESRRQLARMNFIEEEITPPLVLKHLTEVTVALLATGCFTDKQGILPLHCDKCGLPLVSAAASAIVLDLVLSAKNIMQVVEDENIEEGEEDQENELPGSTPGKVAGLMQ